MFEYHWWNSTTDWNYWHIDYHPVRWVNKGTGEDDDEE